MLLGVLCFAVVFSVLHSAWVLPLMQCAQSSPLLETLGKQGLGNRQPYWGRTVRCARAMPTLCACVLCEKVGCFSPPVATGPAVLNSAPPMLF